MTAQKPTMEQARAAKEALRDQFNFFSQKPLVPVNMMGISQDKDGLYIKVGLERAPTAEEKKHMVDEKDGVRVKYEKSGTIRFL